MSVAKSALKDFHYLQITDDTNAKKVLSGKGVHPKDVLVDFPRAASNKEYEKKQLGLALFGLGRIGMIHFLNIMKTLDVELLYCVDYEQERLNYVEFKFNLKCKLIKPDQMDQVFSDPKVDVIIVCTPTYSHEELVLKGLKAGKAVFSEKPLALCSEEEEEAQATKQNDASGEKPLYYNHHGIKRCYDLAEKVGKPLFCAFNRRYDPTFQEIKQRVAKGELGQIHVVKTCARDSPKPSMAYLKTSGGIFHDCAVHDLDLVCWVLGEFPCSVSAAGHSFDKEIDKINDYDTVAITLKFPSGALGIIDLSRASNYGYDQRLEVFSEKGMLASGGVKINAVELHSDSGIVQNNICYSFASRYADGYFLELDDFLQEVRGYRVASIPCQSVLNINKIASACVRSASEGRSINLTYD